VSTTYGQRLCTNLDKGLVPVPDEVAIAEELADAYGADALRDGLARLREFVAGLYADMARRPATYGIPDAPASVAADPRKRRRVRRPVEAVPTLLYNIGLLGRLRGKGNALRLHVDQAALASRCDELRIPNAPQALKAFATLGLTIAAGQATGPLPLALKCFTDVSRLYVTKRSKKRKDERVPPGVFYRVDLRIMGWADRKVRLPSLTVADVAPYLTRRHAKELRELSDHVEALGYRARITCVESVGPTFRASYIGRRNNKTLFGFGLEHNELGLRLSFGDTRRILPAIEQCPTRLRNELLRGRCARCGGNGCGKAMAVVVDGEEREICCFGIFRLCTWTREEIPNLKRLLRIGAGLFENEGAAPA